MHSSISSGESSLESMRQAEEALSSERNFFQLAFLKLRVLSASGIEARNGIEKRTGRWSEERSLTTVGFVIPKTFLLKTKSTVEGLPVGGKRVGWLRKCRNSYDHKVSVNQNLFGN